MDELIKAYGNGQWTLEKALDPAAQKRVDAKLAEAREVYKKRMMAPTAPGVAEVDRKREAAKAAALAAQRASAAPTGPDAEAMHAEGQAAAQKATAKIAAKSPEVKADRRAQIEEFLNPSKKPAPTPSTDTPDPYQGMRPIGQDVLSTMNHRGSGANPAKQYGDDQIKAMKAAQDKLLELKDRIKAQSAKTTTSVDLQGDDDIPNADPAGTQYKAAGAEGPGLEVMPPGLPGTFHNEGRVTRGRIVNKRAIYEDKETGEKRARMQPQLEQHSWSWDHNNKRWDHRGLTYATPMDEGAKTARERADLQNAVKTGQQQSMDQWKTNRRVRERGEAFDAEDEAPTSAAPATPAAPAATPAAPTTPQNVPWRAAARAGQKPVTYSAGMDDDED